MMTIATSQYRKARSSTGHGASPLHAQRAPERKSLLSINAPPFGRNDPLATASVPINPRD
jgi:hypothetical protein